MRLKISYDKPEVIWIGCLKNSPVRYLQNIKFKWNPSSFKVLGIIFSTDLAEIMNLNYNSKMFEIKQIINNWMKIISTPLGRIAIIKSLLISKLSYLPLTLPNPSDNIFKRIKQNIIYVCMEPKTR